MFSDAVCAAVLLTFYVSYLKLRIFLNVRFYLFLSSLTGIKLFARSLVDSIEKFGRQKLCPF